MSVPIRREARAGRWRVALVEAAGLALWMLVFTRLHVAAGQGVADVATANAISLQSLERALRLDIELPVNRWLTELLLIAVAVASLSSQLMRRVRGRAGRAGG